MVLVSTLFGTPSYVCMRFLTGTGCAICPCSKDISPKSPCIMKLSEHFVIVKEYIHLIIWVLTSNERTLSKGVSSVTRHTGTDWNVILNTTFCIHSTWTWAWISAFACDASFCRVTVSINNAFWTAVWWRSNKVLQTWTGRLVSYRMTIWIGPTWWRYAWVGRLGCWRWWRCLVASCKRISCKTWWTAADWIVVYNFTPSTNATCSRTWICALVSVTSTILRTVIVDYTFRSTVGWWASVLVLTWTNSLSIHRPTPAVWSTWRWLARVYNCWWSWSWKTY